MIVQNYFNIFNIHQINIKVVYFNLKYDEEIFVLISNGIKLKKFCKLYKAIYDLKQLNRLRDEPLNKSLMKFNFKSFISDLFVYIIKINMIKSKYYYCNLLIKIQFYLNLTGYGTFFQLIAF